MTHFADFTSVHLCTPRITNRQIQTYSGNPPQRQKKKMPATDQSLDQRPLGESHRRKRKRVMVRVGQLVQAMVTLSALHSLRFTALLLLWMPARESTYRVHRKRWRLRIFFSSFIFSKVSQPILCGTSSSPSASQPVCAQERKNSLRCVRQRGGGIGDRQKEDFFYINFRDRWETVKERGCPFWQAHLPGIPDRWYPSLHNRFLAGSIMNVKSVRKTRSKVDIVSSA